METIKKRWIFISDWIFVDVRFKIAALKFDD